MADDIINCETVTKGSVVQYYAVTYTLENNQNKTSARLLIRAADLPDNPTEAEIKATADIKATEYKADWIARTTVTRKESKNLNGPVTL